MEHKGTQELMTERLRLRQFVQGDAQAMYEHWASDETVTEYLTWYPHDSVESTHALLRTWVADYAQPHQYLWGIELGGTLIGSISVVDMEEDANVCEIGYCIGTKWWNHGYVTEAMQAVIQFLFEEVGCHRIVAKHDERNPASGKVMLKCGLQHEGTHRDCRKNKGEYVTVLTYAILATDKRTERSD